MIGIIGAMSVEVDGIKEAVSNKTVFNYKGIDFVKGELDGKEVVVVKCGVGKVNAVHCTVVMLNYYPTVDVVINSGVAGAILPSLNTCDVVLADYTLQHDTDFPNGNKLPCSQNVLEEFIKAGELLNLPFLVGTIATGDQVTDDRSRTDAMQSKFGELACEDMESAAIAAVCEANGKKFGAIRVISNRVGETAGHEYDKFRDKAADISIRFLRKFLEISNIKLEQPSTTNEKQV